MGAVAEGRIRGDEVGGGQRHPLREDGDDAGGSRGPELGRRGRRQGALATDGGALGAGSSRTMGSSPARDSPVCLCGVCVSVWCVRKCLGRWKVGLGIGWLGTRLR